MTYTLRAIKTIDDFEKVVDLQRIVWGFSERTVVPTNYLKIASETGGLVLGLFVDDFIIGFILTVPAFERDLQPYQHLHMIGIHPDHQGGNYGYILLKKHYEISKSMKINKITWTYDPLESLNANLYLRKCGTIIDNPYIVDAYGDSLGGMLENIPTDRFLTTWYINTLRVQDRMNSNQGNQLYHSMKDLSENYELLDISSNIESYLEKNKVAVEIPSNFQELKKTDFQLSLQWRIQTRKVFAHYLGNNYIVSDFIRINDNGAYRNFYLLEKYNR